MHSPYLSVFKLNLASVLPMFLTSTVFVVAYCKKKKSVVILPDCLSNAYKTDLDRRRREFDPVRKIQYSSDPNCSDGDHKLLPVCCTYQLFRIVLSEQHRQLS